jgi:hypothetical protein
VEAGALKQVVPFAYQAEIAELSEPFIAYVEKNLEKPRAKRSLYVHSNRSHKPLLHLEKMYSVYGTLFLVAAAAQIGYVPLLLR